MERGTKTKPNLPLVRARVSKGLSRRELANMAGLSEKQVGLIERGKAVHSRAETMFSIAQAVDVDIFSLFPIEKRFRR